VADASPQRTGRVARVAPVQPDHAGVRPQHPEDQPHQGGLAGTVEPDERMDLSWVHHEIHAVHTGAPGEHATQAVRGDP
jgi:hypothetical protein